MAAEILFGLTVLLFSISIFLIIGEWFLLGTILLIFGLATLLGDPRAALDWAVAHWYLYPAYLMIGMMYSAAMWYMLCRRGAELYRRWSASNPPPAGVKPGNFEGGFYADNRKREFLQSQDPDAKRYRIEVSMSSLPPSAGDQKARIMGQILYWPVIGTYNLLRDPLKWIGELAYNLTINSYNQITKRMFSDFSELRRPDRD